MKLNFFLLLVCFICTSCTSPLVVLKPTCSELNWFERGRQDGMQGQPSNNWTLQNSDCEKMSKDDIQNYMDGWNHGLSMYCTKEHGFATAKAGLAYKKTCPEKYEESFLNGYEEGLKVFMIERETSQINAQIEDAQSQLKKTPSDTTDHATIARTIQSLQEKRSTNLKTLEKYNPSIAR